MKKEIGTRTQSKSKRRFPRLPAAVKKLLGPKPVIRYSHRAALGIFESLGIRFEVRHFGESRLGLLRWPLRKLPAGTAARRLVFAPGFGDTPLSWWTVFAGLKPALRREIDEVVIIDYPGYSGFLHDMPALDSMDELQRVFGEVVNTLKPVTLMGHSLGAWIAADYAATAPASLTRLILVAPGGLVANAEDQATYRALFTNAIEAGSADLLPHVFAKAPFLLPIFEEEFFAFLKSDEVRSFVLSIEDRHLLNEKVGLIRADTTLIWGDRDTLTPTKWMDEWLARLPADRQNTGILVRGSGHSPQLEKPAVLLALFTQIFLGRRPANHALIPLWNVRHAPK